MSEPLLLPNMDVNEDYAVYCCSHCLWRVCVESLFCCALLCVLSSFTIIPLGKRELVALLLWYSECHVSVIILCLFIMVLLVGL